MSKVFYFVYINMRIAIDNRSNFAIKVYTKCIDTPQLVDKPRLETIEPPFVTTVGRQYNADHISKSHCKKNIQINIWSGSSASGKPNTTAIYDIVANKLISKNGWYNVTVYSSGGDSYIIVVQDGSIIWFLLLIIMLLLVGVGIGIGIYIYIKRRPSARVITKPTAVATKPSTGLSIGLSM